MAEQLDRRPTKPNRKRVTTLRRRMKFLKRRLESPDIYPEEYTYDAAEAAALEWAIGIIEEEFAKQPARGQKGASNGNA